MQINVGLIELKNDWIVRGFRRELTRFPRLNVGQSIDGQSAWALRPFFVFCCFFFFSSSLFLTKPRRESNANRQAVAKIFSFSPFLFFFFSLSLSRAFARSPFLNRLFFFFYLFFFFRSQRQAKNLLWRITRRRRRRRRRRVDNIQTNTCADVIWQLTLYF